MKDDFERLVNEIVKEDYRKADVFIDSVYRRKEPYGKLFVRTLRKPLHLLEKEYLRVEEMLKSLQLMTEDFIAPENSCLQYHVIYKKLKEVCDHLNQYKYIEETLLLPKALQVEGQLLQL